MNSKVTTTLVVVAIIGLALHGLILGRSLQRFRKEDRSISVKGFSEREVQSDLAVWTIRTRIADNDLAAGSKAMEAMKGKVVEFLKENGFKPEEIIQKDLIVNDKKAQEYEAGNAVISYRFIIDNILQVRSNQVELIEKVSRMTDELLRRGVMLSNRNEYQGAVRYYYTKLGEIKPAMLTDATRNAHNAAVQFAKESSTRLGKLKKANQGLFTVMDRDESLSGQAEGGFAAGVNDLVKKVRVVVSVEYSVE
ncbi:MAG: SIMPL domain-containing protein [Marinilabiliales bacterium]|nr:SIMPL domain-containing protein [Marinilabiliales bacterium]